jgi:hypothetical protein
MKIDFDFNLDSEGGDPDSRSPTLRAYHQILWSKPLPNGKMFNLSQKKGTYLYHNSELGEFYLGSDAITHSYKHQKKKQWLVSQISKEVDELYKIGSTIGAYTIFPKQQFDRKKNINQARGTNSYIDDRFDLTLECIRLFYLRQNNPLQETLIRYKNFFDLFENFKGYIDFFLLNDLVDEDYNINFYLPFDHFKTAPKFENINDYLVYKIRVENFVKSRNDRIDKLFNKS